MMSFMPGLCRRVRGEELRLPNIATWWCGQQRERRIVLERMDQMALAGAFGNPMPGVGRHQSLIGSSLSPADKAQLRAAIERRGIDYVGQEVVKLSTTPVWRDGQLQPRPFTLRVFAARTPAGWTVMPGGFCRISHRPDARAVVMSAGAESADVWVTGDRPVEQTTLLPTDGGLRIRRILGNLPSRAADNLFWFGRYLERAEAVLRLARAYAGRLIELNSPAADASWSVEQLERLFDMTGSIDPEKATTGTGLAVTALFSKEDFGSAFRVVSDARRAASTIRERLSPDTWRLIQDLCSILDLEPQASFEEVDITDRVEAALRRLAAISGLAQENMTRGAGWHLLDLGRRVERGINTCRFARRLICPDGRADGLGVLLELIDSQITYRSRYLVGLALPQVRDMVLLDPYNPRSVAAQVDRAVEHLRNLPLLNNDGMLEVPLRLATAIHAQLSTGVAAAFDTATVREVETKLLDLGEAIGTRYFLHGAAAVRADRVIGLA